MNALILCALLAAAGVIVWWLNRHSDRTTTGTGPDL